MNHPNEMPKCDRNRNERIASTNKFKNYACMFGRPSLGHLLYVAPKKLH